MRTGKARGQLPAWAARGSRLVRKGPLVWEGPGWLGAALTSGPLGVCAPPVLDTAGGAAASAGLAEALAGFRVGFVDRRDHHSGAQHMEFQLSRSSM